MFSIDPSGFVDLVRKIVIGYQERDDKYFEKFILPAWTSFNNVHENYKISFQDYQKIVVDRKITAQFLLERIKQDSVYTQNIRSELSAILNAIPLPPNGINKSANLTDSFLDSIYKYFMASQAHQWNHDYGNELSSTKGVILRFGEFTDDRFMFSNNARREAIFQLRLVINNNKIMNREKADKFLKDIVRELQSRYDDVAFYYYQLRTELLE